MSDDTAPFAAPYPSSVPDLTPDIQSSQYTLEPGLNSDFTKPEIPRSLQKVRDWIIFSDDTNEEFIVWWLQTDFGKDLDERRPNFWDRSGGRSKYWHRFRQVAHSVTGEAKVMCNKCGGFLDHPSRKLNGTTPMKRHLEGRECQEFDSNAAKDGNLQTLLEHQAHEHPARKKRKYPAREKTGSFDQELWEQDLLAFITTLHLPSQTIEHPTFRKLIQRAQSSQLPLEFPSPATFQLLESLGHSCVPE